MSDEDFHRDPDAGVEPLDGEQEDAGVQPLDPEDEHAVLEELENEWEDEEAQGDDE